MKVSIEDAEFYSFHGYYHEERLAGNVFRLNVSVTFFYEENGDTENIENTFNYEQLYSICKSEMEKPRKLLETVAHAIVKTIESHCLNPKNIYIRIDKIGPQLGGKVGKAVIELSKEY